MTLALTLGACSLVLDLPGRAPAEHTICDGSGCRCAPGWASCEGDESRCETRLDTYEDCGACGISCANGTCLGGACVCERSGADCDGEARNGCEADLLADPDNCGSCGRGCEGGECIGGRCQPVVIHQGGMVIRDLAVVGDNVYFLSKNRFMSRERDQQAWMPSPFVVCEGGKSVGVLQRLTAAGDKLYAVDWSDSGAAITACSIRGDGQLSSYAVPESFQILNYAVLGGWLYMAGRNTADTLEIRRRPLDGSDDKGEVIWSGSDPKSAPVQMVVNGNRLVWQAQSGLFSFSPDTRRVEPMLRENHYSFELYTADFNSFFGLFDGAALRVRSNDSETIMLGGPFVGKGSMVSDGAHLYVAFGGDIARIPVAGGRIERLAEIEGVASLAVDDRAVYWLSAGQIFRLVK